ncbi:uncharacterized protein [Asterias amurensis]|uniref:uncharacterized protein n=1 Tax=Asterias amurensis TaxID=7602 RepID=UPI003AB54487
MMEASEHQNIRNAKTAGDGMDDDEVISSTDADTSSWESEPNTARSSRQYYPIKGQSNAHPNVDTGDLEFLTNGLSSEEHLDILGDSGLLSSQYLKKTLGVEANDAQGSHQDGRDVNGQMNRQGGSDNVKEADGMTSDSSTDRGDEDIIELDLTKEPKGPLLGNGFPGLQHSQFGFLPSLGGFGASPFGSLMTGLLSSDGDGFENDADVSSQSEAEEVRHSRERVEVLSPGQEGGTQQERWDHLFTILEQQHVQQLTLQREHHERQVEMLQLQLARLTEEQEGLISKQHQEPLGRGSTSPRLEATTTGLGNHLNGHEKQARVTPNGKENERTSSPGFISVSSQEETDSASGDSDQTLEGSLEDANETLMTTWTDVMEQKQAEMVKDRITDKESKTQEIGSSFQGQEDSRVRDVAAQYDNHLIALQREFAQQQHNLQEQYASQVRSMQHQWLSLQQQQQEQQTVIRHLLSRQQERINQTQRDMRGVTQGNEESDSADQKGDTDRDTPTSDDTSTTYSDFTYWKQAEQDTYKALPDMSTDEVSSEQKSPPMDANKGQRSPQTKRSPHQDLNQRSPELHGQWVGQRLDQRSPHLSGQSSSPGQTVDFGEEDANLSSRLNLREKHARHIADLKAYYDSEIQDLQAKLIEATALSDHSPNKTLERTNQRLQNNCVKLETSLKSANSRIEDLETTVQVMETRLAEPHDSTNNSVTSLLHKVNDLKQLCRHKESDIQTLEKKKRELQVSLDQAYQLQDAQAMDEQRDQKILKRVSAENKALAEKHEITRDLLQATETQLYDSKAKIADLTRVVSHLEFEVRRIDLESSVLKRQSVPESLSGTSLRSDNTLKLDTAVRSPYNINQKKDQNKASPERADRHSVPNASGDAPSVGRSVEDRKFLKSSFNMFTGKELVSSGSESLQIATDSESSSQLEDDRVGLDHSNNLDVPLDLDEERPLSPMMKAARQFDMWKVEESMNAGSGFTERSLNETLENEKLSRPSHHNSRQSSSNAIVAPKGDQDGGPLTSDASIHIWASSKVGKKRSPGSSKASPALARSSTIQQARTSPNQQARQSSPNQQARQSLAKAIKPQDHDIFPVKGSKDSPKRSKVNSPRSGSRQSTDTAPSPRKQRESPRRQLFTERNQEEKQRLKRENRGVIPPPDGSNNAVGSILSKIRAGEVQTRADWEVQTNVTAGSQRTHTPKNQTESNFDIIERINDHQKKLDDLIMEKRQLETALSHVPISGRLSRSSRKEEELLEQRLEQVTQQLGSVRMLLRKYNALKSSI